MRQLIGVKVILFKFTLVDIRTIIMAGKKFCVYEDNGDKMRWLAPKNQHLMTVIQILFTTPEKKGLKKSGQAFVSPW